MVHRTLQAAAHCDHRTIIAFGRAAAVLVLVAAVLIGCGKGQGQDHEGPGMSGGPVPVSVVVAQPESVPLILEYAAQTQGSREVEVRSRVTGILLKRNYREGGTVEAGQSLFTVDPAPFEAAVARAEADVAAVEARHDQAKREVARLKPLREARAVSRKDYDDAVSAEAIAAADLQAARARLREAQLSLDYTRVESPITGVASRALKSEGSLVSGPDVLLTTVTQVHPIHVLFGISDNEQLELRREIQAGRLRWPKDGRFRVTVKLADGSEYQQTGVLDFTDVRVSRDTGTSEARAELPNPNGVLRPGQFVRVKLNGAVREDAFKVPQRAVLEGPQGKFVYVVGKEGTAEMRPVEVSEWAGESWIVTKGLAAGEQVIVDGVLKLGPGALVQASPVGQPRDQTAGKAADNAAAKSTASK